MSVKRIAKTGLQPQKL